MKGNSEEHYAGMRRKLYTSLYWNKQVMKKDPEYRTFSDEQIEVELRRMLAGSYASRQVHDVVQKVIYCVLAAALGILGVVLYACLTLVTVVFRGQ